MRLCPLYLLYYLSTKILIGIDNANPHLLWISENKFLWVREVPKCKTLSFFDMQLFLINSMKSISGGLCIFISSWMYASMKAGHKTNLQFNDNEVNG